MTGARTEWGLRSPSEHRATGDGVATTTAARRRWARRAGGAVLAGALITGLAACGPRYDKQLLSTNAAGTDSADQASWGPVLSPDGTRVAFESRATNLGPADANSDRDIYVRDVATGETELVSVNVSGTDGGDGDSSFPWFSPDGSKLLFFSEATDLTPITTDGWAQIFLRDLEAGTTTLVTVSADGAGIADNQSDAMRVSPDGRRVIFTSRATNLVVPAPTSASSIYERDLATGVTTRIADGTSAAYSPSGDAVAFIGGDNVWLRNPTNGALTLVTQGVPGRTRMGRLAFSADGRQLAYQRHSATSFDVADVYVYDRVTRVTTLATPGVDGPGARSNAESFPIAFHPTDPDLLLLTSEASNLVATDTNGYTDDVFVRDIGAGTTTAVSRNHAGTGTGRSKSTDPEWVGESRKVAFVSDASDLVGRDTNGFTDVFVHDLDAPAPGGTTLVSANADHSDSGRGASGAFKLYVDVDYVMKALSVSADGSLIAFGSDAGDLGPTDTARSGWPEYRSRDHDIYVARVATPPAS